jgi:sulfur carrier protein
MLISLNGDPAIIAPGGTVADLLPAMTGGFAVALNGTVIPRHRLAATPLADGDAVEIVTAVQGG